MKKKSTSAKRPKSMPLSEKLNAAPEGILVLSFLLFALAILTFSFSVWMLTAADEFAANAAAYAQAYQGQGFNISEMTFINFGVVSLFFALLFYFVGKGLLAKDNRARFVLILLAVLILISSLYNAFTGAMFYTSTYLIVITAIVLWYLMKKSTVAHFK